MRTILLATITLATVTSAALAGPIRLTDRQMDQVTAGRTAASGGVFPVSLTITAGIGGSDDVAFRAHGGDRD